MINKIIRTIYSDRLRAIEKFRNQPHEVQSTQFATLMRGAGEYIHRFGGIYSVEQFQSTVPIVDYETFAPWIERIRGGENRLLWSGSPTRWFAKSSGTTNAASKYIPITSQYLKRSHFQGGKDVMALFCNNFPTSKAFDGKALTLGGSAAIDNEAGLKCGDLSAILIDNAPSWLSLIREPKKAIALIPDFERKVDAIARTVASKNVTSFAGVPSWNLVLMNKIIEFTGKGNLSEVWPNLELFIHGGIAMTPYQSEFNRIIPSPSMHYMETYNASEGFFALQDDPSDSAMLLMLDYDIFYEFLPLDKLNDHSCAVTLEGVKTGINYAMIISCSGGLWRYMIGDTVEFTSISPYKIKITGRTKHFINAFGEELIIDNAESALQAACKATGASIADYTAAPIFMRGTQKGSHEWVVEFSQSPSSVELFALTLDQTLRAVNSDYDAKRNGNATLVAPTLTVAPSGTFFKWMASRGKVGGQNKVPRLSGSRQYVEALKEFID